MDSNTEQPAVAKKVRRFSGKFFLDKSIDLIIVVVGVYIAFQFNSLKENADQRSLEQFYLRSMILDLDQDIKEIEENLQELRSDKQGVMNLLSRMEASSAHSDSLGVVLFHVLSFDTFNSSQNTYATLVNSNGMRIVGRQETLSRMTQYYNRYTGIHRFEKVYTDVLFKAFEYFSPYCDFATQKVTNPSVLKRTETRNFLLIIDAQLKDGIENYESSLQNARVLHQELENTLRK